MGTAKLLAACIESEFPGLNIVGTYPSYSIKDIKNVDVDLILSTVPVKEEKQTQTEDDEEYPGIEYIEIPAKKTKSSCLVM